MGEAAGLPMDGIGGALRTKAIAAAWAGAMRTWLSDESPDLSRTMAALDQRLRWVERMGLFGRAERGGGGAGGRIALIAASDTWTGRAETFGGDGAQWGASGTVYRRSIGDPGAVTVANNNRAGPSAGWSAEVAQDVRLNLLQQGHLEIAATIPLTRPMARYLTSRC